MNGMVSRRGVEGGERYDKYYKVRNASFIWLYTSYGELSLLKVQH